MDFNRKLVALHGLPGVGKDTMADLLVAREGYTKLAFADSLYEEVSTVLGYDVATLRERVNKTEPQDRFAIFHSNDPAYRQYLVGICGEDVMQPRTTRYHMERYGTDFCRHIGDPLRWVTRTVAKIEEVRGAVVVPDLRAYTDRRELTALKTLCFRTERPLCIVELLRDVPAPSAHEANRRLSAVSIDAHVTAVPDNVEATYQTLVGTLQLWFGDD